MALVATAVKKSTEEKESKQEETCFVSWEDFEDEWDVANKDKSYVVHPKWPGSRPCATRNGAAKGSQAYLAAALHKACLESDKTTRNGTSIAVFQKPTAEVRIVGGLPHYFWRLGKGQAPSCSKVICVLFVGLGRAAVLGEGGGLCP